SRCSRWLGRSCGTPPWCSPACSSAVAGSRYWWWSTGSSPCCGCCWPRWWSAGSYGSATGRRAGARPEPPAPAAPPSERWTGSRRVGGLLPVDESERLEVPQCLEGQHAGPRHPRAPARAGGRIVTPRPDRPPGSVLGLFVDQLVELTAHFGSQRTRQLRVGSRRDGQGLEA